MKLHALPSSSALAVWIGILLTFVVAVSAQPDNANDECSTATYFTVGSNIAGNFNNAKPDGPTIPKDCIPLQDHDGELDPYKEPGFRHDLFSAYHHPGVWYAFHGTGRRVAFSPIQVPPVSVKVIVYKGSCGAESLECVTAFYMDEYIPVFTFETELGVVYRVNVRLGETFHRIMTFSLETTDLPELNDNDICSDAIALAIGIPTEGEGFFSTADQLEVTDDCIGGQVSYSQPGVWYTFQGTGGKVTATVSARHFSGAHLAVYTGACGSADTLTCVAGTMFDERVSFYTDAGTTYYVLVRSGHAEAVRDHSLEVIQTDPAMDLYENDDCARATPITMGESFSGDMEYASYQSSLAVPASCSGLESRTGENRGLWYSFQGTGERVTLSEPCDLDGAFLVTAHVYKGSCGATTLECVASFLVMTCYAAPFVFNTEADATYYVLIQSDYDARFTMTLAPSPPLMSDSDVCATATPLVIGSTSHVSDLTLATSDEKEVYDDCSCGTVSSWYSRGLWYSFEGDSDRVWVNVCGTDGIWRGLKLAISVYKGDCGPASLQCVAGSPLSEFCTQKLMFNTEAGTKYHVLVQNKEIDEVASEDNLVNVAIKKVPSPPPNDACSGAQLIAVDSTIYGDASFATTDELEVSTVCNGDMNGIIFHPGLWYRFQGTGTNVEISRFCDASPSSTTIHVYRGSCGPTTLTCLSGYTFDCTYEPVQESFHFYTNAGSTYYMLVQEESLEDPTNEFQVSLKSIRPQSFVSNPNFPIPTKNQCIVSEPATTPPTIAPTTSPSISPTTTAPTSIAPTTVAPTSPTTLLPSTIAPTTLAPTSLAPTSLAPTSISPTSLAPTSFAPTSLAPTTIVPTTTAPTDAVAATVGPTTITPTTIPPTTIAPSSATPTTVAPTPSPTASPSTSLPAALPVQRRRLGSRTGL